MTVALVMRVDQGGLAAQTRMLQHCIQPDAVLLVDLDEHKRRGDSQLHRMKDFPGHVETCTSDVIPRDQLVSFARQVDVLLTVECLYTGAGVTSERTWRAVNDVTTTVLVANPELWAHYPAYRIVLPTMWEQHRLPNPTVIPHPVDVAAVEGRRRVREHAKTFLHVEAPAMLDRNGTELVAQALARVKDPCTLIVRSYQPQRRSVFRNVDQVGKIKVVWDDRRVADWQDGYDDDIDVLVLPRRYGGLSMIAQEAAALGIPSIMLDLDPQRHEAWPGWRVPARVQRRSLMRGGEFNVHTCNPVDLAGTMNNVMRGLFADVAQESVTALSWSTGRSWTSVKDRWARVLAPVGART